MLNSIVHINFFPDFKGNARSIYSFNKPNQLVKHILPLTAFAVKSALTILLFLGAITWHSAAKQFQFQFQVLSATDTRTAPHLNLRSGYNLPKTANWQISKLYSHHLWRLFLLPQNHLHHGASSKKIKFKIRAALHTYRTVFTKFLTIHQCL